MSQITAKRLAARLAGYNSDDHWVYFTKGELRQVVHELERAERMVALRPSPTVARRPIASDNAVTWRKYAEHVERRNEGLERMLERTLDVMIVVVQWAAQPTRRNP